MCSLRMEQISTNTDAGLRRLKRELGSLKEAGDGLQTQMDSMMGALQELKLLQVQTALERLDISGRPIQRGPPRPATASPTAPSAAPPATPPPPPADEDPRDPHLNQTLPEDLGPRPRPSPDGRVCVTGQGRPSSGSRPRPKRSTLGSASTSSLESASREGPEGPGSSQRIGRQAAPRRGSGLGTPPPEPGPHPSAPMGSQALLDREEGPSPPESQRSQDGAEDDDGGGSSDWTSSLMSQRRNRQPLVLGDNVFADLVGNWLDLPQLERGGEGEGPAHPLRLSKSQEICRKFSLATNIFKKVLRGVRPDRDKLLKERRGWEGPGGSQGDLPSKRPKKATPKGAKGSFYLPCWAAGTRRREGPQGPGPLHPPSSGCHLDRKTAAGRSERTQPLFDHHSAVWV